MSRLVPVFDRIGPCDQSEYSCGNEDQRVKNYIHTHIGKLRLTAVINPELSTACAHTHTHTYTHHKMDKNFSN